MIIRITEFKLYIHCLFFVDNPGDNLFQRPKRSGLLGVFDYISEKKDMIKEELFGRNKMF